ncbi:MAG: CAP domain-containing protein [Actinomycetota bacterium]
MTLTNDGAGGQPSIWGADPPPPGPAPSGPTTAGSDLSYGAGHVPGADHGMGQSGWDDGWNDPRPPWRSERSATPLGEQATLVLGVGAGGVVVGMLLASILFLFVFNGDGGEEIAGTDGDPFAGGAATTAAPLGDDIAADPLAVDSNPLVGNDAMTDDALADDMAGAEGDQTMTTNPDGSPVVDPNSTASTAAPTTAAPTTAAPTTAAPTTVAPTTAAPTTAAPTTAPPAPGAGGDDAAVQQQVLAITNQERAAAGCPALTLNAQLNTAADAHSEDMLVNDYFDHTDLRGGAPWDRAAAAGYQGRGIGENIALGYADAADVMNGWMNSPGHRANILNCSYQELGVGYARNDSSSGGFRQIYWTQLFGS